MFIATADAELFALAFGDPQAPAILGLGGWIGNWELWAEPFARLSQRWHTLVYDHRGTGASLAPVESITFERLLEDVPVVLDAFGVQQAVLAAESAGVATALAAARRYPERIRGLVLVDGLYFRTQSLEQDAFYAALHSHYPTALEQFIVACTPEPDCHAVRRWGRQILQRADPAAAIALYRAATVDLRPDLPHIRQPALVIHGADDRIVLPQQAELLASSLPNARLHLLSGAGHVPTLTQPAVVAHLIDAFLQSLVDSGQRR